MPEKLQDDPVLKRFRAAVTEIYGERIERVVMFGSRARGDPRPDSDYDIAVFLHDMPDRDAEMDRLADLSTQFLDETGELIHAMLDAANAYQNQTPLMHQIRSGTKGLTCDATNRPYRRAL